MRNAEFKKVGVFDTYTFNALNFKVVSFRHF